MRKPTVKRHSVFLFFYKIIFSNTDFNINFTYNKNNECIVKILFLIVL